MPRVYLAGPITGCSYEGCTDWRNKAREELADYDIEAYSPMRAKGYLRDGDRPIADAYDSDPLRPLSTSQGLLARDRMDVMACDLLLVNFLGAHRVSIGTCVEVGWADLLRKPVVLVMEPEGNVHDHSFLTGTAGFRAPRLEDAIELVKCVLLPDVGAAQAQARKDREQLAQLKAMVEDGRRKLAEERAGADVRSDLATQIGRMHRDGQKEARRG